VIAESVAEHVDVFWKSAPNQVTTMKSTKKRSISGAQVDAHGTTESPEYKVGPGRPPKEFRFQKGISGNPKGRKPKPPPIAPDLKAALERALNEKVPLRQGERTLLLSKAEAGILQLVNQFAKGDRHARRDLLQLADRLGIDLAGRLQKALETALGPDHQSILDAYVERRKDVKSPTDSGSASPRVIAPPELLDDDNED
jgi:uncharacterized protein DUF5681